jgi:hypothetical protein
VCGDEGIFAYAFHPAGKTSPLMNLTYQLIFTTLFTDDASSIPLVL